MLRYSFVNRLPVLVLKVRLSSVDVAYNTIAVRLNGQQLPEADSVDDIGYRIVDSGSVGPYGAIWHYTLAREHLPVRGMNTLEITLLTEPPNVDFQYEIYDVVLDIKHKLHRHFEKDPAGVHAMPVPRL